MPSYKKHNFFVFQDHFGKLYHDTENDFFPAASSSGDEKSHKIEIYAVNVSHAAITYMIKDQPQGTIGYVHSTHMASYHMGEMRT